MSNPIAERLAQFVRLHPPFNLLEANALNELANALRVYHLSTNEILFKMNDPLHDCFYLVASGVMHLLVISDAEEVLLDKCAAGDVLGLRPLFAKNNYQMTAKAREDSIVFGIPLETFRQLAAQNPQVMQFLLEHFASLNRSPLDLESRELNLPAGMIPKDKTPEIQLFQSLDYSKKPLVVPGHWTIQQTAIAMTDALLDHAVMTNAVGEPIGIITDSDLRMKVATGRYAIQHPVEQLMSKPVITVAEDVSLAEAQLNMLKYGITHLIVTVDGTEGSALVGTITQGDLIAAQSNNPGVLLRELKKAKGVAHVKAVQEKLNELIHGSLIRNIPVWHIEQIANEVLLALHKRAIELAIVEMGSPPTRFAWMAIGSLGRKEQLLLTDQDSIIVFDNVAPDQLPGVKAYFIQLALRVTAMIEEVGFPISQNGHSAREPFNCKPLDEWIQQYRNWLHYTTKHFENLSPIYFDLEMVYGDGQLEDAILDIIYDDTRKETFLDFIGNQAIRKPSALNFFKKFNLEESGSYKELFNLKERVLMPIVEMTRMLALHMNLRGINNTYARLKQLALIDPKYAEIYIKVAEAYLKVAKWKTLEGIKYDTEGAMVNIKQWPKKDREELREIIDDLKPMEELIKDNFKLTQFS